MEVVVDDDTDCKAAWTLHVSKLRIKGLATSKPSWDFRNQT